MKTETHSSPSLRWDIFCRVIDNHGDLGVCWRLCADLAQRGHTVRLWVDDASALAWMAPHGCAGVSVHAWPSDETLQALAHSTVFAVGDVVVEAFGCELPEAFQALMVRGTSPVWINLEYLSAEGYVARSHGLASPVMSGPARGMTKWFFFPGFTPNTGGLLREPDLAERHTAFDRTTWLSALPLDKPLAANERLISLFCYEPTALPELLKQLSQADEPTRVLVAQGRPCAAVAIATQALHMPSSGTGQLHISQLPYFSQTEFDHLLWACDLNFVRGEDSLVRALWAGQPLVWHIYQQDDLAHHDKLHAFEAALDMPLTLRRFHAAWNGLEAAPLPTLSRAALESWRCWSRQVQRGLQDQTDLTTQLLGFVAQKR
ncbi:elongation factor P maturation arginine rhamnosyltransferase EarP [Limnohabitans sp.]|uniref:elongation factor P maturation arginine rhamnosyltransferase EarP n=1 Tax=Limnohabitans sp. TaxID=1907725 RepID=UPI00286F12A9|nr:elongation factor P maturation arginine rhamnosyltransferase EarP [Limnohabitans sp.]